LSGTNQRQPTHLPDEKQSNKIR